MRDKLQARLQELRRELETGQIELQQLQARETYLREMVLRISGAKQVLEELLADGQPIGQDGADPGQTQPATVDQPLSEKVPNDE